MVVQARRLRKALLDVVLGVAHQARDQQAQLLLARGVGAAAGGRRRRGGGTPAQARERLQRGVELELGAVVVAVQVADAEEVAVDVAGEVLCVCAGSSGVFGSRRRVTYSPQTRARWRRYRDPRLIPRRATRGRSTWRWWTVAGGLLIGEQAWAAGELGGSGELDVRGQAWLAQIEARRGVGGGRRRGS